MTQPNHPHKPASPEVTLGHTERVSQNPGEDPVARRAAEKAAQAAEMDSAIEQAPTLKDKVIAALQQVYDPEIPLNIYELGLIYDIEIDEQNHVRLTMTLTSPACPVAQELPLEARAAVERVPEVTGSEVELTFDPPWSMDNLSDAAKLQLGFL